METIDISAAAEIFTISRLNREVRFLLEEGFPLVWVEGEISNFIVPSSGHWYFTLKDENAQVRCAMFKPNNRKLNFIPKNGMHVLIKSNVSLYEGRGDFQLLANHMEEIGEGRLRQAFEELKQRLFTLGLFQAETKKPIPTLPKTIGIITSATGAAVHDILNVLKRRFPLAAIIIYPTLVQGDMAAKQIVAAIQNANKHAQCDVLLVARGGGSLEDLWPFNEENVAYAIFASIIPIISGIGHEIDFTIADFVADIRAPTPSAAAELATPDQMELLQNLLQMQQRLVYLLNQKLIHSQQTLAWAEKNLQQQHPKRRIQEQYQQLDQAHALLARKQAYLINKLKQQLALLNLSLAKNTPLTTIKNFSLSCATLQQRLGQAWNLQKQFREQQVVNAITALETISPLATLKRGYAIAERLKDRKVLRDTQEIQVGDKINIQLMHGSLNCTVDEKNLH